MLKELHDLAGQHEVIAENTHAQLIPDIQKCVAELKNNRKKVSWACSLETELIAFLKGVNLCQALQSVIFMLL